MRSLALIVVMAGCAVEPPAPASSASGCAIAVVNSDYSTSSVSLLAADGTLCADNVIHSGSVAPKLVNALSGDVTLPTSRHPDGTIILLDRFYAVLTALDPTTLAVARQVKLPDGSNPHDVAYVGGTAYVSLADANELLGLDSKTFAPAGSIDLQPLADPGFEARPSKMTVIQGRLAVCLVHMETTSFANAGPGVIALVEPSAAAPARLADFGDFQNCAALDGADEVGAFVAFTGVFEGGEAQQIAHSGLAYVDLVTETVAWSRGAQELFGRPIGRNIAAVDSCRVLVLALGNLTSDPPNSDKLYRVDRCTDEVVEVAAGGAYELGAVLVSENVILLADANPAVPLLRRTALDTLLPMEPVMVNPAVGLPPREAEWFQ